MTYCKRIENLIHANREALYSSGISAIPQNGHEKALIGFPSHESVNVFKASETRRQFYLIREGEECLL